MEEELNDILNYKKLGSGEPIFVLHGLFGMLDNWMRIGKWLSQDYTVLLVDQRNHGKSTHFSRHNYALMAKDLLRLLDNQGFDQAHLIGHSMGAKTVMQFAGEYPDRLKSSIIVDMSPLESDRGHEHVFEALFKVPIKQVKSRNEVQEILHTYIDDEVVVSFLMKNLVRRKDGGYRWKMNLPVICNEYEKILEPIELDQPFNGPALSIKGALSDYVNYQDEMALFKLFPNIDFEEIYPIIVYISVQQWLYYIVNFLRRVRQSDNYEKTHFITRTCRNDGFQYRCR
jgi:pimeloyl-ACP methyl ester carboxylesterase